MKTLRGKYDNYLAHVLGTLYSEKGQGLVEYALLIILIAVVVIVMLKGTGQQVNVLYSKINSGLSQ